jgi:Cu(I)/Ag(I) efflux system membrane fusion protein
MTSETTNPVAPPPEHPKRGFGIGALLLTGLLSASLAGGGVLLALRHDALHGHGDAAGTATAESKPQYQCPMHPTIVQDHPGDCPICGMKLVKVEKKGTDGASASPAKEQFSCPMHPTVVQDGPGKCPLCGMNLVKVESKGGSGAGGAEARVQYQCPMHPTIVQDHPGDCPICGMKLVKAAGSAGGSSERKILFYRSPMDPKQTSHEPKKDEMGMDYVPVYEDQVNGSAAPVQGLATVDIDPARQQLIGLSTAEVTKGKIGGAWRTAGRVAMDETRIKHINVKIPGFVERIYVDFLGKPVKKGDPLFSLYSPELLAAQQEYLLALKTRGSLAKAGGTSEDGESLVKAARRKLQLWDVPESELEKIEKTGEPVRSLTFYSPLSGAVTKKDVVEGMKLDAGAMPYEIVDLSTVWVFAEVYESELRHVKLGMAASLTLNAFPEREFKGQVAFIDPLLNPQTRTIKVRMNFPNPTGDMRPDMFGEVVLLGKERDALRIPTDAVIDSGTERIVFLAQGDGKFQPRKVKLGDTDGTNVEVISGLNAGERVVTRANFLIDSESRLKASLAELTGDAAGKQPESARVLPDPAASPQAASEGHGAHGAH